MSLAHIDFLETWQTYSGPPRLLVPVARSGVMPGEDVEFEVRD